VSPVSILHHYQHQNFTIFSTFPFSDLTHFPLSGFSPTDTNHVDTPFTVPGLEHLPPLHTRKPNQEEKSIVLSQRNSPSPPKPPTKPRTAPTKPKHPSILNPFPHPQPSSSRPTHIGDIFTNLRPSSGFPSLFDPFRNFFHLLSSPSATHDPHPVSTTVSTQPTVTLTTPHTTPRPVTVVVTEGDSVHDYHNSDYGDFYNDYPSDAVADDVSSDYLDYDEYHTDDSDPSSSCPGSLRKCLTACSLVITINQVAYKLCVNECLDRCS
jgi:hypothetical protein